MRLDIHCKYISVFLFTLILQTLSKPKVTLSSRVQKRLHMLLLDLNANSVNLKLFYAFT